MIDASAKHSAGPTGREPSSDPAIPGKLAPDWIYQNIQEVTVNCRKLLFIYLALLSYGALSALTTPVENLFLGQNIEMPIIKTTIPLYHYLIVTPLLAIGFFIYNQLHLRKINRLIEYAIDECRAIHPNCDHINPDLQHCTFNHICRHHQNRLYPWIFIFSRYSRVKTVRRFQYAFIWCAIWFFLPATLITFTLFVLKKHDYLLFYLMLSMTVIGFVIVFFFWNFHQHPKRPIRFMLTENSKQFVWFVFLTILFVAVMVSLHIQARNGHIWWVADSVWKTDVHLHDKLLRSTIFVNLMDKQLVPDDIDDQDYSLILKNTHFEGANFSFANLEKSNFKKASIKNANLIHTKLIRAELSDTILNKANLSGSQLNDAKLTGAHLRNCDLAMADLTGADLTYAKLSDADLRHANMNGTILENANIRFADFRGALSLFPDQIKRAEDWQFAFFSEDLIKKLGLPENHNENLIKRNMAGYDLPGIVFRNLDYAEFDFTECDLKDVSFLPATDLRKANFKNAELNSANLVSTDLSGAKLVNADLTKADLTGSTFTGADLSGIILDGANMQWADVRGALNLTVDAVKKADHHILAYFDKEMIAELGLTPDHNIRLMSRNFTAYDFMHLDKLVKSLNSEFLPHHEMLTAIYSTPLVVVGNVKPNFFGAQRHSGLKASNLSGIDLTEAQLQYADLTDVSFQAAKLKKTNFTGSILKGGTFSGANLDGCILKHAKIFWADFRSAKNLTPGQVKSARGYQLAKYGKKMLNLLELDSNHNHRLEKKFLYDYNLGGASLIGVVLDKADLRRSVLNGANLTDAILDNASLEEAKLRKAILTGADLTDANLQYAVIYDPIGLTKKQLSGAANYKLAYYSDKWLSKLDLPSNHNERLRKKDFKEYNFHEANLKRAKLMKANLEGADFRKADLEKATLEAADLTETDFTGADLQYADMRNVKGINRNQLANAVNSKLAYYSNEWLSKLNLPPNHNERLRIKDFKGYKFHGANFSQANLETADLSDAHLQRTNLSETNLRNSKLNKADLKGANLCKTAMDGADLQGADLRGIHSCEGAPPEMERFASVKTLYQAILDEPLRTQLADAHPDLFTNQEPQEIVQNKADEVSGVRFQGP